MTASHHTGITVSSHPGLNRGGRGEYYRLLAYDGVKLIFLEPEAEGRKDGKTE